VPIFLLDENINHPYRIIDICAEFDIQVLWIYDVDMGEAEDEDIFDLAMKQDYVIVTGNISDFRPLHTQWSTAHPDFPGIVYVPGRWHKNVWMIVEKLIEAHDDYGRNREWWVGSKGTNDGSINRI